MSPYREAGPGAPSDDPLFVEPGKGLRGIWVGRATPDDVLGVFGDDADIARYESGEIFQISYMYGANGKLDSSRPEQRARPAQFGFEFGLLDHIYVSASQHDLFTAGRLRYLASYDEVLRVLGDPDVRIDNEHFETLRYLDLGIDAAISHSDRTLSSYVIFRARR